MVVFGVAGYAFKKLSYPLAPMVLAIVLGDRAEASFRQAMLVSQGGHGRVLLQCAGGLAHRYRTAAVVPAVAVLALALFGAAKSS